MNSKTLRTTLMAALLVILAGCDPNPSGPSAPSAATGPAPARPDPKAAAKGSVPIRVAD